MAVISLALALPFTLSSHTLSQILSERVGFTYSLRAPPEGTSTNETIEMVVNGSADMAASWITITSKRLEYVSFTYPYYDIHNSFIYKPTISDSASDPLGGSVSKMINLYIYLLANVYCLHKPPPLHCLFLRVRVIFMSLI